MKTIIYQTNHQANNDGSKKIHQVLREFTRQSMAPLKGGDKIEIIAQNKLDEFIGGIVGCFVWQWLEIDALVVIDAYREKGIGSTLLKKIEAEAKRQNIYKIRLNTFGFQTPEFYRKTGYQIVAIEPNFPPGNNTYYMHKQL